MPIKILQVLPALKSGGVERTVINLANYFCGDSKLDISVASCGGAWQDKLNLNVIHHTLPLHSKNPLTIYRNIELLKKIINDNQINIVHAHSRAPAWSAYFACKALKIPFVTSCHAPFSQNFIKYYYNKSVIKGCKVIVPSKFIANYLNNYYPKINSIIIGGAIDPTAFADPIKTELKAKWRNQIMVSTKGASIVGMAGRFSKYKNFHGVIEAIAKLPQSIKPMFVIAGHPHNHQEQNYINEMKSLAIKFNVSLIILDSKEIPNLFKCADLMIVGNHNEAFGLITAEAMLSSAIVLGYNSGGAAEIIDNKECLFNNMDELTDRIEFWLNTDQAHIDKTKTINKSKILKKFNIDNIMAQYKDIYEEVTNI